MAPTQRHTKNKHKQATNRGNKKRGGVKEGEDSHSPRREKYSSNEGYRERVKEGNRKNYRRNNPKKESKLTRGLLFDALDKEVVGDKLEYPIVVPVYNMTEAANALGKTPLAFKRWIKDEMIPPPILQDTIRGFNHYSVGELQVIATILRNHEKEYTYFLTEHVQTVHLMWQGIEAYRKQKI